MKREKDTDYWINLFDLKEEKKEINKEDCILVKWK